MRILFLTEAIPYPAITGAPLRNFNLLRRLARAHEVWLAAFVKTPEQSAGVAYMQEFCEEVATVSMPPDGALRRPLAGLRYLLNGKPPDFRFSHSAALAGKIRHLISRRDFDVVHIDHTHMGIYLQVLPKVLQGRAVWMLHDVDFSRFARLAPLEAKLTRKLRLQLHSYMLRRWQPRHAESFKCCITVSEADRRLLLSANPRLQVEVAPNGIDTRLFQPLPENSASPALVFVGNMDYLPCANAVVYFCEDVLPRIRQVVPEAEMWIVGTNPRPEVKQLAGNGVHVTGRVEDVRPYYQRSTVCVVPLRAGGGTRLKILEAMALGRPVVSTSIGCEGLEVREGEHLCIADAPEPFAEKTISLLTDAMLRRRLTHNARQLVVSHYDWEVIAKKLIDIYAAVAGESGATHRSPAYQEETV